MESNTALIGYGYWGKNYARTLDSMEGVNLKYIGDMAMENIRGRYVRDIEQIINAENIDSVIISTPTKTHYDLTKRALEYGKHVLVEKPFTKAVDKATELEELARKVGKQLMVGHTFIYNPAIRRLREEIENGSMGKILYMDGRRLSYGPIREEDNVLWDLAPHDISIFLYLTGQQPKSVNAIGSVLKVSDGLHDIINLSLKFEEDLLATLNVSWIHPLKIREHTIVCDRKMAVFDDSARHKLAIYDIDVKDPHKIDQSQYARNGRVGGVYYPNLDSTSPLEVQCRHFFDCIENGTTPITNARNGVDVVRILNAAERSLEAEGGIIEL